MDNKETKENKYVCEKCRFYCNTKGRWEKHINTELHKTGKRKKRSDYQEPLQCEKCEYKTKNKTTLKTHKLSKHGTVEEKKKEFRYYCEVCDYGTYSKDAIEFHNNTKKHKQCILIKAI
jgi:hypothetical protein